MLRLEEYLVAADLLEEKGFTFLAGEMRVRAHRLKEVYLECVSQHSQHFVGDTDTALLEALLGASTETWQVSLHTGDPGDYGDHEVEAAEYTRLDLEMRGEHRGLRNQNVLAFGPARSDWGTVTHFGVWLGSNLLWANELSSQLRCTEDISPTFEVGSIFVNLD